MNDTSSKGREIKLPGPDHPITISPASGKVRVTVSGTIVAESQGALLLEEKDAPPFTTCRVMTRTCPCSKHRALHLLSIQGRLQLLQHPYRRFPIGKCRVDV